MSEHKNECNSQKALQNSKRSNKYSCLREVKIETSITFIRTDFVISLFSCLWSRFFFVRLKNESANETSQDVKLPARWSFSLGASQAQVTIIKNSRATCELGIHLLRGCTKGCCNPREWKPKSTRSEDSFYPSEETLFISTVFQENTDFQSVRACLSSSHRNFQCSCLKNAVLECMCYGQGGSHVHLMAYKNIITLKWCFMFDANPAKRVRDRDSHCLLQTCIVLFTNSQFISMIPPLQDASWCLQGCQIMGKKENKDYKLLSVMMLYFTELLL